jgi:hypothetical protein
MDDDIPWERWDRELGHIQAAGYVDAIDFIEQRGYPAWLKAGPHSRIYRR